MVRLESAIVPLSLSRPLLASLVVVVLCLRMDAYGTPCVDNNSTSPELFVHDCSLRQLVDEFWNWRLRHFPEITTMMGINDYNDLLESFDEAGVNKRYEQLVRLRQSVDRIQVDLLSLDDNLTLDILVDQLDTYIAGHRWKDYGRLTPISNMEGIHRMAPSWVKSARYQTDQDYRQYLNRLTALPTQIGDVIKLMQKAISLNRTNHAVSMRGVLDELRTMYSCQGNESIFYLPFNQYLDHSDVSTDAKDDIRRSGLDIITTRVQPAWKKLSDFIEQKYLPATRRSYGVGSFANGAEYYGALLRWYLSVNETPSEIHQLGFSELHRVHKQLTDVAARLGHSGNLSTIFRKMRNLAKYYNHTEEEYLTLFNEAIHQRIRPRLSKLFHDVEHLPELMIKQTPTDGIAAMYASDTLFANNRNPQTRPSFDVLTLSLHEGLPGHHLQISIMSEQNLPNFRRHIPLVRKADAPFNLPYYTAYLEGWGLYAEYLGEELGLFEDDDYELFSRYSYEIFRACRLVVDTGIHAFGWSRDQAIEFVANYTFQTRKQIEIEVDRYITFPGQACSYKIGELKFKKIRSRAASRLGSKFDIRAYHSAVLNVGPMSLSALDKFMDKWILSQETRLWSSSSSVSAHCYWLFTLVIVPLHCSFSYMYKA